MRAGAKLWFRGGLEEDGLEEDVSNSHAQTTNSRVKCPLHCPPKLGSPWRREPESPIVT